MPPPPGIKLDRLPGLYAICRMDAAAPLPVWLADAPFISTTRTADELSIVAPEAAVPPAIEAERGWRAMRVRGTLAFNLVGILAQLTTALADAGVPVFVISTFDTDYLLVKQDDEARAAAALARWLD